MGGKNGGKSHSVCVTNTSFLGPPVSMADSEDPHPSLSDFTDYEPALEFDDTYDLSQAPPVEDGKRESGIVIIFNCFTIFRSSRYL